MKHTLRRAKQRYDKNISAKRLDNILRSKNRLQLKFNKLTRKSVWAYKHRNIWYIIGKQGSYTKTLLPYTLEFHTMLQKRLRKLERSDELFDHPDEEARLLENAKNLLGDDYLKDLSQKMGLLKPTDEL